jgi:t-SNARE complex subunit (syntaxin)
MMFVYNFISCVRKVTGLAQMSVLVEQQDETITAIETQADTVQKDMETGYVFSFARKHNLTS